MCDVGKRTTVDDGRRLLRGLHEIGRHSVFQQHHDGTSHAEVFNGEWLAVVSISQQNLFDAATQILLTGGQTQDGHELGGWRDVEASLLRKAVCGRAESRHDAAQGTVVHVEHATPQNLLQSEAVFGMLIEIVVEQGANHVVGRGDGVEIAREVQVDALHWQHLCVAAACCSALHAEARTQ